jgi:hypothetical protein
VQQRLPESSFRMVRHPRTSSAARFLRSGVSGMAGGVLASVLRLPSLGLSVLLATDVLGLKAAGICIQQCRPGDFVSTA